jgi:hypothetical protein
MTEGDSLYGMHKVSFFQRILPSPRNDFAMSALDTRGIMFEIKKSDE